MIFVVLFITFDVRITFFVMSVVGLTIVYMLAICHFWGLTFNYMIAMNINFALGVTVDYSVHIAHKYLVTKPPNSAMTNQEIRNYKVSIAISQMGSSVFHGGFSTLLAVSVLFFGHAFFFEIFFKTWFPMIFFGMLNGMVLQSILLSIFGPVNAATLEPSNQKQSSTEVTKDQFSETELTET